MERGFTVVELLAVIVIIALLSSITMLKINDSSIERRKQDYKNMVKLIEKNTSILISSDNEIYSKVTNNLVNSSDNCKIFYQVLIDNNLVDETEKNPITGDYINPESYTIVSIDNNYNLKYKFVNIDENTEDINIKNCLD